ncbi:protein kinase [Telmatocola sphagniphila]|uniref:Protein kinase n=1 Tax=Telmatocola sphagniphila TaxID=1123043 RepID=A0A8E6EUI2_9BACT|nr:protein kinase [Telmatocola sphagniphila]QVL31297.1 protein kinase [Telmatocola sphagniphila]
MVTRVVSRWQAEQGSEELNSKSGNSADFMSFASIRNNSMLQRESFPAVGDIFMGFKLVSILGTGGFARVYLAQQENLADRPVALKVTSLPNREPQRLARLQHQNIMPIHSVHYANPFQAVCMPYLGTVTLHDVIRLAFKDRKAPSSGGTIFETERAMRTTLIETYPDAVPQMEPSIEGCEKSFRFKNELLQLGYVEAILTIVSRICDGLEHAHNVGVIHRDLKPANILLSTDGQPLLLDFNLAVDVRSNDQIEAGGTIPYMAPEQLRALMKQREEAITPSCDLYALGIIAYELLTGSAPFPALTRENSKYQFDMSATENARKSEPDAASKHNPEVPVSVDIILRKLLAYHEKDRYESAAQLKEDIDRQLKNLSLRYARDPITVRIEKLHRRNRKVLPSLAVTGALILMGSIAIANDRLQFIENKSQADKKFLESISQLDLARVESSESLLPGVRDQGLNRMTRVMDNYLLLGDRNSNSNTPFEYLSVEQQGQLRERFGESLLILADQEKRKNDLNSWHNALDLNKRAEKLFGSDKMPEYGWQQQKELAEKLEDKKIQERAGYLQHLPESNTSTNSLLKMNDFIRRNQFEDAIAELKIYIENNPTRADGHILLANCYRMTQQSIKALERLNVAISLDPKNCLALYKRAEIQMDLSDYDAALKDINNALAMDSLGGLGYWVKAKYYSRITPVNFKEGLKALYEAEKENYELFPIYALRIRFLLVNNFEEAKTIIDYLNQIPARGIQDYSHRAWANIQVKQYEIARQDYEAALSFDPNNTSLLLGLSTALAFKNDYSSAAEVCKRVLEISPRSHLAQSSLAIYLARLGEHEKARKLADESVVNCEDPEFYYKAACVYSLGSQNYPEYGPLATRYLVKAATKKFEYFNKMEADKDIDPIRKIPEYKALVKAKDTLQNLFNLSLNK